MFPERRYRHPGHPLPGAVIEGLVNAVRWGRWRRRLAPRLPFVPLVSDVRDVVYLTWLLPLSEVAAQVPAGVTLWSRQGLTPLTILTYRHGHFGPAAAGPLRRLFPSPLQSNWRLYLADGCNPRVPPRSVLFIGNVMDSLPYVFGSRLASDSLLTQLPARFVHEREATRIVTRIEPGRGGAPALTAVVELDTGQRGDAGMPAPPLPAAFASIYGSPRAAFEHLTLQDAAVTDIGVDDGLALARIALPIDPARVRPLRLLPGSLHCPTLEGRGVVGPPLAFLVESVRFDVLSECWLAAREAAG